MKTDKLSVRLRAGLVTNETSVTQEYSRISFNASPPTKARIETLEGRKYTVVPMVMLTEGVHNGSHGPIFYDRAELAKFPQAWNHKPLVVNHPTFNGQGVSACDAAIIESHKIGLIMNTKASAGRLTAEAWIDAEKADKIDKRVMVSVRNKRQMELSTGLYFEMETLEGKWKNEAYDGVARNFRPDHLAILPDSVGACSIADGAGLMRNSAEIKDPELLKQVLATLELSYSEVQILLSKAIRAFYNMDPTSYSGYVYICDVFNGWFVYDWNGKKYKLTFTQTDAGVTLGSEDPVEVVLHPQYKTLDGVAINSENQNTKPHMEKKAIIAILLANSITKVGEVTLSANMTDAQLASLKDEQLAQVLNEGLKPKTPAPAPAPVAPAAPAAPVAPAAAPAANAAPTAPLTVDAYIAAAPEGMREVLRNSVAMHNQDKANKIAAIVANKRNRFTKEYLETLSMEQLNGIHALAFEQGPASVSVLQPNYAGQGQVPIGNEANTEEALAVPTLNFDDRFKKKGATA